MSGAGRATVWEPVTLTIDPSVLARFPDLAVVTCLATGIRRAADAMSPAWVADRWDGARAALAGRGLSVATLADDPAVTPWRTAAAQSGLKPSAYRSSVEALGRRLLQGGAVRTPLVLVDAYCAVSAAHLAPIGAYDVARLPSLDVRLRHARPATDMFEPLGAETPAPPTNERVVVYAATDTVLCWGFNHRDSRRTSLTPDTETALFLSESLTPEGRGAAGAAVAELAQLLAGLGAAIGPPRTADARHPAIVVPGPAGPGTAAPPGTMLATATAQDAEQGWGEVVAGMGHVGGAQPASTPVPRPAAAS